MTAHAHTRNLEQDMEDLAHIVQRVFGIDPRRPGRQRPTVDARRAFCYVAKYDLGIGAPRIAAYLDMDPSTVTYHRHTAEDIQHRVQRSFHSVADMAWTTSTRTVQTAWAARDATPSNLRDVAFVGKVVNEWRRTLPPEAREAITPMHWASLFTHLGISPTL